MDYKYAPRLVGEILAEMLMGDSPLAKGYRKYRAAKGGHSRDKTDAS